MTFVTGTVTKAEAVALYRASYNLAKALEDFDGGGVDPAKYSIRFTKAELDALVTAVSNAIAAANAS